MTDRHRLKRGPRGVSYTRRLVYLCGWRAQASGHPVAAMLWLMGFCAAVATPVMWVTGSATWPVMGSIAVILWGNAVVGAVARILAEDAGVDDPESVEVCTIEEDQPRFVNEMEESRVGEQEVKVASPAGRELEDVMPARRGL